MTYGKTIFQGSAHVFAYGLNALVPVGDIRETEMIYFVGSKRSKLLIRDYRQNPLLAANRTQSDHDGKEFADLFNQPAYVEVKIYTDSKGDETVEAKLSPTSENVKLPTLWFGVYADQTIPILNLEWEFIRPINVEQVAFMIKIPPIRKMIKFVMPLEEQIIS